MCLGFPCTLCERFEKIQKILFLQEVMSADKQEVEDMPKSGSITNSDCMNPDDIQVLSSEVIVIEGGVRDDVAGAEPN